MSQGFIFFNQIDKLVDKKTKELKLKPTKPLAAFKSRNKRFYAVPAKTNQGQTVFFKMLISGERSDQDRLKRETALGKSLTFHNLKIIKSNTAKMPYWFLREYLPGPLIGHHFTIYKSGKNKETQKQIVQTLISLQPIKPKIQLQTKTFSHYLLELNVFQKNLIEANDNNINFKQVYNFFEKQKSYFNKKDLVLAHGDFTMANFFINNKNIYLTDWENARYDNLAADISRLWIQTYRYPSWRKSLVLLFLKKLPQYNKGKFKELFRAMALFESIKEFMGDHLKSPNKSALKKSMLQTIKNSQKSFEQLIKKNNNA